MSTGWVVTVFVVWQIVVVCIAYEMGKGSSEQEVNAAKESEARAVEERKMHLGAAWCDGYAAGLAAKADAEKVPAAERAQ